MYIDIANNYTKYYNAMKSINNGRNLLFSFSLHCWNISRHMPAGAQQHIYRARSGTTVSQCRVVMMRHQF